MKLQPAGRRSKRKRQPEEEQNVLDPVALTIALWLGVVVAVTGFIRLGNDAANDAALVQARQSATAAPLDEASPFNPKLMALGN